MGLLESFVVAVIQFQIPYRRQTGGLVPVVRTGVRVQALVEAVDLADVPAHGGRADDAAGVQQPLDDQEYLRGDHRLDEIVVDLLPDGVFHQALFLGFRDHHHRQMRADLLDFLQRGQAVLARHHFVQEHQVVRLPPDRFDRIVAGHDAIDTEALALQKEDMRPQGVDFVIDPQNASFRFGCRHHPDSLVFTGSCISKTVSPGRERFSVTLPP